MNTFSMLWSARKFSGLVNWKALVLCAGGAFGLGHSLMAQAQATAAAGEVVFVAGTASRQLNGGGTEAITKGLLLNQGDQLRTEDQAYVYVRMADGGLLVMRPLSRLSIDRWKYDASQPAQSEIKYTLDSGVARYVSGKGSQAAKDKFRFNTPLAAIGVRGTDFTVLSLPDITQVSVRTGGVAVGTFAGGCAAEALGPCRGEGVAELFASASDKLLQVRLGERLPQLLDASGNGPDKVRPPANGEPQASNGSGTLVALAQNKVVLSDKVQVDPSKPGDAGGGPNQPLTIATWGRWGALPTNRGRDDPSIVTQILQGKSLIAMNRYYVIAANPGVPMEMPGAGVGQFKLADHAGLMVEPGTGKILETTANNGSLSIDFGARRFQTSMDLQAAEYATRMRAQGSIEASGKIVSDRFNSESAVEGLVGGKNGSEAIYAYKKAVPNGGEFSGVAYWKGVTKTDVQGVAGELSAVGIGDLTINSLKK